MSQSSFLFLVHAADDPIAGVENSLHFYAALTRANVPAELHVYAHGGHGFGVRANRGACSSWPDRLRGWCSGAHKRVSWRS